MQNLKTWFLEMWAKLKEFMLRKWQGVPMYVWVVLLPLVLILIGYFFLKKPKNSTSW